ncbi:hypothetical protein AAIB33_16395 [Microbacterium sp. AZCO]|uniref:hypothetical protein n=1 Tax=Microbacterium sp. AZCO TaxID=3142976 RepID=UPI0031F445C8
MSALLDAIPLEPPSSGHHRTVSVLADSYGLAGSIWIVTGWTTEGEAKIQRAPDSRPLVAPAIWLAVTAIEYAAAATGRDIAEVIFDLRGLLGDAEGGQES